jgi:hypothetical protein
LTPPEAVLTFQREAVAHSVQLALACEIEDFDTAVGQLAHMPSNQFLSVQPFGVGEGC